MRARQCSHYQLKNRMAPTEKAQQELEQIERQVAEMESNGPTDATRREIAKLQSKLGRLNPVEHAEEYNKLFGDLVALEQRRRKLRERGI